MRWDAHDQAMDSGTYGIDRDEMAEIRETPDPPDWADADPTEPARHGWEIPNREVS